MKRKVLVVGAGAVGQAIHYYTSKKYDSKLADQEVKDVNFKGKYDFMHICFPYSDIFVRYVVKYIQKFEPSLTLVESTVKPGTTREIIKETLGKELIVHSPVRGRHDDLIRDLKRYTKFIGGGIIAKDLAEKHYKTLGFKTYKAGGLEETEFAKLLNLSYFAAQICFFQEVERLVKAHKLNYRDLIEFFRSTTHESGGEWVRPVFYGGFIKPGCVMEGIRLLYPVSFFHSLRSWLEESNRLAKREIV